MKRSSFKPRTTTLKATPFKRIDRKEAVAVAKIRKAPAKKVAQKPKQSGRATNAEREHMGHVAALGCILCRHLNYGHTPAEVHHVRVRHGWGRSGHFNTIPLCREHHTGQPGGVHDMGREQFTAHYGISELDLLAMCNEVLAKNASARQSGAANNNEYRTPAGAES